MSKPKFTTPYGSREIYFDDKLFITIQRADGANPTQVDDLAKLIAAFVKKSRKAKAIASRGGFY